MEGRNGKRAVGGRGEVAGRIAAAAKQVPRQGVRLDAHVDFPFPKTAPTNKYFMFGCSTAGSKLKSLGVATAAQRPSAGGGALLSALVAGASGVLKKSDEVDAEKTPTSVCVYLR